MKEISRMTWWLLTTVMISVVVITTTIYAGALGFWEPWESVTMRVGADAANLEEMDLISPQDEASEVGDEADDAAQQAPEDDGINVSAVESFAVPTLGGQPVHVSWLKAKWATVFIDSRPVAEVGGIGTVERRARIPLLALAVILFGATALWVRRHLGDGPAAMATVVLSTSPIFYFGAIFISAPLMYVAATSLAVMAFFQSIYGDSNRRLIWALAGALALVVVALDMRFVGVLSTLAVLVGFALAQAVSMPADDVAGSEEDADDTPDESEAHRAAHREEGVGSGLSLGWVISTVAVVAAVIGWGWAKSRGIEEGFFRPDVVQQLWIAVPLVLLAGLTGACRTTPVGRALTDIRGILLMAGGAIPLVVLGMAYASALPVDPELAEQGSPALSFLLENQIFAGDAEAQGNFAWWWRQVGFGLLPHMMWLLPALGYLGWKLRLQSPASAVERAVAMLCLVWPVAAFVVVVPASALGHIAYPAFFPLVLAIGWMIGDEDFWRALRLHPASYLAIAVVAIFTVVILTGDLDDFSSRLIEFALGGVEDADFAEQFEYGSTLDVWKRAMLVGIGAYFAGMISWLVFAGRDARRLWQWIGGLWRRFKAWRNRDERDGTTDGDGTTKSKVQEKDRGYASMGPGRRRMAQREAWRDGEGILSRIASRLERMPGLVGLVTLGGVGFFAFSFATFIPEFDEMLSSRAVIEHYRATAEEGESLWKYEIDEEPKHFYVRDLETIENRRQFNEFYESDERFFALIPADDLAQIHSRVRRDHQTSLPVLAAGGSMYLITNQLSEGETDVNPLAEFVLDEVDEEQYIPLVFDVDGEEQHPNFDRRIEFLGYHLDRGGPDQRPVYRWGDTMEFTMYFKVKRRISSAQEIFMHIDLAGNRIHGDHDPVGGQYPTNYWLPGDIIKDVHEIEVERFSTPGLYTIWMGFYRGDDRMEVRPEEAHDGQDRLEMGTIEIAPF